MLDGAFQGTIAWAPHDHQPLVQYFINEMFSVFENFHFKVSLFLPLMLGRTGPKEEASLKCEGGFSPTAPEGNET